MYVYEPFIQVHPTVTRKYIYTSSLDLRQNQIPDFPASMCQKKPALMQLYMQRNKIVSIPDTLYNSKLLVHINLSHNDIHGDVLETIGNLRDLETLYLENNSITSIPEGIGKCTKLTILDLRRNCLSDVPNGVR